MSIVSQTVWKENGILSFIDLFFFFFFFAFQEHLYRTNNVKKTKIKFTTNVCFYIRPFCDII